MAILVVAQKVAICRKRKPSRHACLSPEHSPRRRPCGPSVRVMADAPTATSAASEFWTRLREFPALSDDSPLVLKAAMRPSFVVSFVQLLQSVDPQVSVQAHAGNGVVIARFSQFDSGDVAHALIAKLQPAAAAADGHVVVLASQGLGELTRQAVFGGTSAASAWMQKVKRQFDPHGLLNPGRFDYA